MSNADLNATTDRMGRLTLSIGDSQKFRLLVKWLNQDYDLKVETVVKQAKSITDKEDATVGELMSAVTWQYFDLKKIEESRLETCRMYETQMKAGTIDNIFDQIVVARLAQERTAAQQRSANRQVGL
ncbi:hypothetical protein L873DRAFT_1317292 [Choiromyces venosus 120613-1]|uniref:Uncharacterized protein n=1 Tax=Choiromyces venosus 120613-1 TaxID=1336337 RepID=A0A3N4JND7_9PEZI|nr:hypothetical protein L873DRAFT_1317292 [Choiromyces venosus 120613-1]